MEVDLCGLETLVGGGARIIRCRTCGLSVRRENRINDAGGGESREVPASCVLSSCTAALLSCCLVCNWHREATSRD